MRKWVLFLLFFVLFDNSCIAKRLNFFPAFKRGNGSVQAKILEKNFNTSPLAKQNLIPMPLKGGEVLSNPLTYLQKKDSTFQLVKKIPIQSTYLTTDNLQNLYIATEEGQIIKFDKNGNRQFEYNNNRLGKVGKIDIRNPLTILVYYPELEVIILLDRTLSEIKELNLYELDIFEPKVVALANDNNIWIYDEVAAILKKINQEGETLSESRNLNQLTQKQLNPAFLQEYDNQLFLSDVDNGLFIFDAFGQLKQTLPNKEISRFQIFDSQLFFQKNGDGILLEIDLVKEKKIPLPSSDKLTKDIYLNSNLIYLTTEDSIEIYSPN